MFKIHYIVLGLLFIISVHPVSGQKSGFEFTLNTAQISETLKKASTSDNEIDEAVILEIPNHVGVPIQFEVIKSSVLSPEMEAAYPDFMTYSLQGVDQKLAYGRIFVSRFGVEGVLMMGSYRIKIEPNDKNNPTEHRSYLLELNEPFTCLSNEEPQIVKGQFTGIRSPNGATIRNYEMAIVATGEFYQHASFGNNVMTTAQAAVVNIINMINVYWNAEMSILISIYQTPTIYTNPTTDPFNPAGGDRHTQAANAIHSNYLSGGYDLGHALHATAPGGSGVAGVGVVCSSTLSEGNRPKARGWSGGSTPNILAVSIMTHEVGHMFNSPHTFNGALGNCLNQHDLNTAYEIGSGSTIMSYAGICEGHNIQSSPDLYFHSKSLELFYNYVTSTSGNCSTNTSSGNNPPTVNASICAGTFTIPALTPFELTGSGSDPDGDNVLYVWEQIDEDGPGVDPTKGYIGSTAGNSPLAPLFRSYPPTTSGFKRTFPAMNLVIANNYTSNFEPLPNATRTLNFRLVARDVRTPHAAYQYANRTVLVDATKGPLTVTAPNTNVTISAGTSSTVTWAVNTTNLICNSVNVLLSVDGGLTYPYTLLSNTPNDGTQSVTFASNLPPSTQARIRVESSCMTCLKFFDISNVNFTINSSCNVAASNICDISPVTAPEGSSLLNLTMNVSYGDAFTSRAMVPSGSTVLSSLHSGSSPGTGGCTSLNFGDRAATFQFKPSVTGNYSFNMVGNFRHASIYTGTYTPGSPCTNFLGSSAYGGGQVFNPFVLPLNACNTYTAVFFDTLGMNGTLYVTSPAGGVTYLHSPPSNPNYSYTYVAVNSSTNIITAVSATASFSTLSAGSYCVYGIYYYSGASNPPGYINPATFVGQTLAGLYNLGACVQASFNCKPITVTEVCQSIVTSSSNDGAGTLRRALTCNPENTTITFHSSVTQINLTALLSIQKNMTLQGINSNQRPQINTASTGINILSGKTLTLNNVDIKHTGSQTIHGGGVLNISGVTVGRQ